MRIKIIIFLALCLISIQNISAVTTLSFNVNITSPENQSIISPSQVTLSSFMLVIDTNEDATCKYSTQSSANYNSMSEVFELEYGRTHKKTINNLIDGQYKAYVICKNNSGYESKQLEITYSVNIPITAQISLENGQNLKDGKTEVTLITSKTPKTVPSLSYTTDGSTYQQVPLIGSEKIWKGYIIITPQKENKVGSFKFQARDLEDNIGTEITSGTIFTIDTIAPNGLLDIRAEPSSKGINLTWKSDEEDLTFNIYRSTSPGTSYSHFYKTTNKYSFVDTDVSSKTTYYYKVSAIDLAGNEGPLSGEIAGVTSFNNEITSEGLDLKYVVLVDSLLDKIDSTSASIESASIRFSSLNSEEKNIYDYLKLSNSISNAKNSLTTLKNEVKTYKTQTLTKTELEKKINSAEVRLNIIKSNSPENLRIKEERILTNNVNINDISSNILEISPGLDYKQLNKKAESSIEYIQNEKLKVSGKAYNIEIRYSDDSQKVFTLVKKAVQLTQPDSSIKIDIIESIPKDIAQSTNDLNIYNSDYEVLKEDPIISFNSDTDEIVYYIKEEVPLNSISNTKTFILEKQQSTSTNSITGYVSLDKLSENFSPNIWGGLFLIVGLGLYFLFIRTKKNNIKVNKLHDNLSKINEEIEEGKINQAVSRYSEISNIYKTLTNADKKALYPELNALHVKLTSAKKTNSHNNMSKSFVLIVSSMAIFLLMFHFAIATSIDSYIKTGKNQVIINSDIYADKLVELNPEIQSITYYDEIQNETYAYLNVFGGIGKKFLLENGKEYEIASKKDIILNTVGG